MMLISISIPTITQEQKVRSGAKIIIFIFLKQKTKQLPRFERTSGLLGEKSEKKLYRIVGISCMEVSKVKFDTHLYIIKLHHCVKIQILTLLTYIFRNQ